MSHPGPETFAANARAALGDATLTGALRRATDLFAERRAGAIAGEPEWEALRERARAIKAATLARLDEHLERFAATAAAAGATVHWAVDAAAACSIVRELVDSRGARRLVKSKSMATEEIGLNAALAAAGAEPVETDLGEWIIQLAGEAPSHIIVPAIHKTKESIGELFVAELGIAPTSEPAVLAAHARERLRAHFAAADLGISGVNFGVAETGTILILENEGNARMTTTLPRVHVAVMGIEKVIPRWSDLEVFLRLLPRSGTGQRLTTYQSLLTGPEPAGDGPRELHVVLLDNGRSRIAADERMRSTLACIRCGACLNACPVYQSIGGHAYGSVYPGPIGAILTPQLAGLHRAGALPFASSLCGACKDVCPVKIDIPSLLLELRARVVAGGADAVPNANATTNTSTAIDGSGALTNAANLGCTASPAPNASPPSSASSPASAAARPGFAARVVWRVWAWTHAGPRRFWCAMACARLVERLPFVRRLAAPLRAWSATRELPRLAARSFRSRWRGPAR